MTPIRDYSKPSTPGPSCSKQHQLEAVVKHLLSPQFVNYISTSKANTQLFLLKKNLRIQRILTCYQPKNNSVFALFFC